MITLLDISPTLEIVLWVAGFLVVSGLMMIPLTYYVASICAFDQTLRRTSKEKWKRGASNLEGGYLEMYHIGEAWLASHSGNMHEVEIVNRQGMTLKGEYYDLGYDRCVIILLGRTETIRCGYYFAIPYADFGMNVLVIDPRAHGDSDGEYNTVGFEESIDNIEWAHFLHTKFDVKSIIFHGICIGSAGGMLAITKDDCPDYIDGIVTDGMFTCFGESMKKHLVERKKPIRFFYELLDYRMMKKTGHSMSIGPIDFIDRLKKPLLMLQGTADRYSTPENAEKLFRKAGSENKRIVYIEGGEHSMIRFKDTELYDSSIKEFLISVYGEQE